MSTTTVDFTVLDNGVVKFTASPVDAVGNPTTFSGTTAWSSSDDTVLQVAADTTDATGLTAIGKPVKLGTGIVATITGTVTNSDGSTSTITGSATPVDVVAGPAASFVVAEQ